MRPIKDTSKSLQVGLKLALYNFILFFFDKNTVNSSKKLPNENIYQLLQFLQSIWMIKMCYVSNGTTQNHRPAQRRIINYLFQKVSLNQHQITKPAFKFLKILPYINLL